MRTGGRLMSELSLWRTISVVALAAVWLADLVVFVYEYRKEHRGPLFWWSLAGIVFLGLLTVSDWKSAKLEEKSEQQLNEQLAWRKLTPEQHQTLVTALKGHPVEVWTSFVGNDPESTSFRAEVDEALKEGGVTTKYFSGLAMAVGLQITDVPGVQHDLLVAAFSKAGIPFISVPPFKDRFKNELMIIVGTKPPPN
jgi:hypothetical protein